MLKELRRIVTGHDGEGRSLVAIDGPPGGVVETPRGGIAELWVTDGAPADNSTPGDAADGPVVLSPPDRGSRFRFFALGPEDESLSAEERERGMAEALAAIGGQDARPDTTRDPGMHKTRTVDYIVLLKGEVTLVLDDDEVELKPFDAVVQRGTNHAWRNRGREPALLAGVLIDAEPL